MKFDEMLAERTQYCGEVVKSYLPGTESEVPEADAASEDAREIEEIYGDRKAYCARVIEAMNYSVEAGGKRLRPLLMLAAYRIFCEGSGDGFTQEDEDIVGPFMAAIEMIHTYSLVHDDLPEMDNDRYRRGQLTTHAKYGAGMAVLAGDGLLNYAYELVASTLALEQDPELRERMVNALFILASNAGIDGMVGGQCADLMAEGRGADVGEDELMYIHTHKTACMIESALMTGAVLAGAPEEDVSSLYMIGEDLGIAFQIRDDILDVEGNAGELGKDVHQDDRDNKTTYVSLFGMDKAKEDVRAYTDEALELTDSLSVSNEEVGFLKQLILELAGRTK